MNIHNGPEGWEEDAVRFWKTAVKTWSVTFALWVMSVPVAGALAGWGVSGILLGDHLSSAFFFLFIGVLSMAVSSWKGEEAQQVRKYEGMAKGTHWM